MTISPRALLVLLALSLPATAYEPPRTAVGKPDFTGVWQAMNNAHYNLESSPGRAALAMDAGAARAAPEMAALGAVGGVPPTAGVVEDGQIPYTEEARKLRDENRANYLERDPEIKCYLPGIPRATYMPFAFQVYQNDDVLFFSYEFAGAVRNVALSDPGPAPIESWMGQSWAEWDGDTLVIHTDGQNDRTWLDRAGNHHSAALKVTERFTRDSDHTIWYEATLEDPAVYTRPWTISMPLYLRTGADARLMQFNCVEFVEELLYGHLRKEPLE